ncbi:MAG: diaminopimelate epimerase [Deltaproteobacteria bacterium]|nr:diaminopimelate epimerase [Deltaproteobacteria bacterium]
MNFTKMHGAGNDFIIIDQRGRKIPKLTSLVSRLSDRRFGIGFDQAIILGKPSRAGKKEKVDFSMQIINADGGVVEMCGNGIRCLAKYIWTRGIKKTKKLRIETLAGIIVPEKADKGQVRVDMGAPILEGTLIPVKAAGLIKDKKLTSAKKTFAFTCVSMGNPHAVTFVKKLDNFDVKKYGPPIESHKFFPNKTNVEFVEVVNKGLLKMRVYERGSGETLACGTGASASAVAANLKGFTGRSVRVILLGGELKIEWAGSTEDHVFMTGPAEEIFTGVIKL